MTTYNANYERVMQPGSADPATVASPFKWLRAGWNDFKAAPASSILLGGIFTLLCAVAYSAVSALPIVFATVLSLLLIVSPYLAVTAYFMARQRERNLSPSLVSGFHDMRSKALGIGLFSALSALLIGAYVRLSSIVFALYFGTLGASSTEMARSWTTGTDIQSMLVFGAAAGSILALILFAIGAITLPLIADRNMNVVSAVHKGAGILRDHVSAAAVWMLLIVALVAAALLSGLILMPVVFPVLAYATWHSYREMTSI